MAATSSRAAQIDPRVRKILVCPQDLGPLLDAGDELYNPRLRLAYPIDETGVIDLLAEDAREVGEAEHSRLAAAGSDGGAAQEGQNR